MGGMERPVLVGSFGTYIGECPSHIFRVKQIGRFVPLKAESDFEFDAARPFAIAWIVGLSLDRLAVGRQADPLANHFGRSNMTRTQSPSRVATVVRSFKPDSHDGKDELVAQNGKFRIAKILLIDDKAVGQGEGVGGARVDIVPVVSGVHFIVHSA